jgi:HK97 gp10 family phage protein
MADGVQIQGLDVLIRKMQNLSEVVQTEVDAECEAAAHEMNAEAAQNINRQQIIDNGELLAKQQVIDDKAHRSYTVQNTAFHAPFQEFGTGVKFNAHPDWVEIAAEFKGIQNGNFDTFLVKIQEWCKRKGIEESAAYVICVAILRNGLEPRPFMQPAYEKVAPLLLERINNIINEALS